MMTIMKTQTIFLLLVSLPPAASAYKTTTHVAITHHAIANSNLQSSPSSIVVNQLDLSGLIVNRPDEPFWTTPGEYVALKPVAAYMSARPEVNDFENAIIKSVADVRPGPKVDHSMESWILRGAIREDDNSKETPESEEPGGVIPRVFGHFYDASNDQGLTVGGALLGDTAKDWSHTDGSTVVKGVTISGFDRGPNVFNLLQTKEALWRALTGLTSEGFDATPSATGTAPANEGVRKAYWATTFRSIGNAIHLIEDMAQPQHTRNDPHSGVACFWGDACLGGHDSYYEGYIGALTTKSNEFTLEDTFDTTVELGVLPELSFAPPPGFNAAIFKKYSDFFSSGIGNNATGIGLANYSSRGFYSAGTNVGRTELPLPDPAGLGLTAERLPSNGAWWGLGAITLYKGAVNDTVTQTSDTAVLTSSGMWHRFVEPLGGKSYTLNRYVYEDQARLLLPRAVAYSTAFINFFFRGKMVISPPDENIYAITDASSDAGFKKIRLKLSAPENDNNGQPQEFLGGVLRAVLKYRRNEQYSFPTDNCSIIPTCRTTPVEVVVSEPIGVSEPAIITPTGTTYTFNFPTALPLNATDVRLQVIYRGRLGAEGDEIVVATEDLTEPTYWSYMNTTDYFAISGQVYTEPQIAASQTLIDQLTKCVDASSGTRTLIPGCLVPIDLSMDFTIAAAQGAEVAIHAELPPRTFARVATLSRANTAITIKPGVSKCFPQDPIDVMALTWEDYYVIGQAPNMQTTNLSNVRGIRQHAWTSCVQDVSGSWATDNRAAVFETLDDFPKYPTKVTITEVPSVSP